MSIEASFGEIRSIFNEQPPGLESWTKLVEVFDACPTQELDALLEQASAYCEDHFKQWPAWQRLFTAPAHWIEQWLGGSTQHARLLALIPSGDRRSYYRISHDHETILSNNGDGYRVNYTAYQNSLDGVRRATQWEKENYLEYAWGFAEWLYPEAEFYSLYNGPHPSTIEVVFLNQVVARFEGIPDITFKHSDFEITLQPAHLPGENWRVLDAEGQVLEESPNRYRLQIQEHLAALEYNGRSSTATNHEVNCDSTRFFEVLPQLPKTGLLTEKDKPPKIAFWTRLWAQYVGSETFYALSDALDDYFFRYAHPNELFSSRDLKAYKTVLLGHDYPVDILDELSFAVDEFEVLDAPDPWCLKIPETDFGGVWMKVVDGLYPNPYDGFPDFENESFWEGMIEQVNAQLAPSWMPEQFQKMPIEFDDWAYDDWTRATWCWAPLIELPIALETPRGWGGQLHLRYQNEQLSIGANRDGECGGPAYGWSWYMADQLTNHIKTLITPTEDNQ